MACDREYSMVVGAKEFLEHNLWGEVFDTWRFICKRKLKCFGELELNVFLLNLSLMCFCWTFNEFYWWDCNESTISHQEAAAFGSWYALICLAGLPIEISPKMSQKLWSLRGLIPMRFKLQRTLQSMLFNLHSIRENIKNS